MLTPMPMTKTQVYLPAEDLRALHRVARQRGRKVADLVREAVQLAYLRSPAQGPIALWDGEFSGSSVDHDAAFDEP
jgi:hypothetical protein